MAAEGEREAKTSEIDKQAAAGLALFKEEAAKEYDTAAAEAYQKEIEAKMVALEEEEKALTGGANKKARTEKAKERSALKAEKKYIDACKVVKGLDPPNGNFVKVSAAAAAPAPAAEAKEDAPKEEAEEAKKEKKEKKEKPQKGLTSDQKAELEKLKTDIIARKAELKAEGLSGGQQNKDAQVVEMVTRMNELKEIECPGSTQKKAEDSKPKKKVLSDEAQQQVAELKQKIEDYKTQCIKEFGMTKKDLKADPDLQDMEKELQKLEGGK